MKLKSNSYEITWYKVLLADGTRVESSAILSNATPYRTYVVKNLSPSLSKFQTLSICQSIVLFANKFMCCSFFLG